MHNNLRHVPYVVSVAPYGLRVATCRAEADFQKQWAVGEIDGLEDKKGESDGNAASIVVLGKESGSRDRIDGEDNHLHTAIGVDICPRYSTGSSMLNCKRIGGAA